MIEIKIYYHDTDCGGVVYYANYLKFLEEARTEFFAEKGLSVRELAEGGTLFVVSRQEIEYKSPAVYGDLLQIYTRIAHATGVKVEFEHEVKKPDGKLVCTARTLTVCVSADLKPKAIPEEIKSKLYGS
jgi:acyl-CoA thioester hydrolase